MGDSGKLTFSGNLRRFRENLGITQEQLGEAADFDRSYIGGVERGERNPSLDAILRLASALRIATGRLLKALATIRKRRPYPALALLQPLPIAMDCSSASNMTSMTPSISYQAPQSRNSSGLCARSKTDWRPVAVGLMW